MQESTQISFLLVVILACLAVLGYVIRYMKLAKIKHLYNFKKDCKNALEKSHRLKSPPDDKLFLGRTANKQAVELPTNLKHFLVCGTTGSGKTVALSNFVKCSIDYNYPMLIIDGKGDCGKGSLLEMILQHHGNKKVYIINMNDTKSSDKYNPFKDTGADIVKDMLTNMTDWTEPHYKLNAERYIQKLCTLLEMSNIKLSFNNILKHFSEDQFIHLSRVLVEQNKLSKDEHALNISIVKQCGNIAQTASSRFAVIQESGLGNLFADDGVSIEQALSENAIIIFILDPLLYPEMSRLIGRLIVIDSKKAVSYFYTNKKKRIFYLFDEMNVFTSEPFLDLVNKSRSANITCILACQGLSDLNNISEYFGQSIVENCNNYLVMRQNSSTNAENWSNILGTRKTMEATYQVENVNGQVMPTNMGTLRKTRVFLYHPDKIKNLATGEAIFLSRDLRYHTIMQVHKPY